MRRSRSASKPSNWLNKIGKNKSASKQKRTDWSKSAFRPRRLVKPRKLLTGKPTSLNQCLRWSNWRVKLLYLRWKKLPERRPRLTCKKRRNRRNKRLMSLSLR